MCGGFLGLRFDAAHATVMTDSNILSLGIIFDFNFLMLANKSVLAAAIKPRKVGDDSQFNLVSQTICVIDSLRYTW